LKTAAFAFACALLIGCATRAPIQFGMFAVPESKLPAARELGLDFVIAPARSNYLAAASRAGLKVLAYQNKTKDRAIMGTILSDEPDLHGVAPEKVAVEFKAAKRQGRKPIFLNLSSGFSTEAYAKNCDVTMFDWYPINWSPIETFYGQLRVARLAAGKKPFYAVVQAFDWTKYPEQMPPASYRKPTPSELKAMAVWAAMNGASGIVFYPFDDGHFSIETAPELASAIKDSIALIRGYDWLFEAPRAWIDYPFDYKNRADQTNAIAETSIAIRAAQQNGATFLVAANTTGRTISVKARAGIAFDEAGSDLTFAPLEIKFLTARPRNATPP
jgi:hypothetical protein